MILWFHEINQHSISIAGGKGANLGEMTQSGFPVPPGFCISTAAYREHISRLALTPYIQIISTAVLEEDIRELDQTSVKVRKQIEETSMLEPVSQQILKAYQSLAALGTPLVSVRSSATAEDLPSASFAGQQETYLSVRGEEQLLKYVKKCWASLWTPRSITYRQKNGFTHEQTALAVVVQAMVLSEKSGVLFTVNPISGKPAEMMINASYGLGESIVSGLVTPDTYVLSKQNPLILEKHAGTKETKIITGPDGLTVQMKVPQEMQSKLCLEEAELTALRELGLRVENHYGKPQDIEWAIADKKVYLLQSRPITAISSASASALLENKPAAPKKLSRMQRKILDNFREHIPDAPYPLDYEPLLLLNEQKNAVFYELGITMPAERKMVLMDTRGILSVGKLLPHPNIRLLWMPVTLRRLLRLESSGSLRESRDRFMFELNTLQSIEPSSLDNRELSDCILQAVDLAMKWIHLRFQAYVFPMVFLGFFLNRFIRKAKKLEKSINQYDFLAGLNYKTAEIEHALYCLADQADKTPTVRQLFLEEPLKEIVSNLKSEPDNNVFYEQFTRFLENYGARTMKAYTPFSAESWSEHPELLFGTLSSILKAGNIQKHLKQHSDGEKKYTDLKDKVTHQMSRTKKRNFEHLLDQFRSAHMGREELVYRTEQCFVTARRAVAEAASRLYKNGLLAEQKDIRYLTLSELKQLLTETPGNKEVCNKAANRKANRYLAEQAWNAASNHETEITADSTIIHGLSGSPGIARGIVRIIHDPEEFDTLQKGEVLVCRFTDPVWTPLFSVACAVVCDTGGPLSHAAIVAREYGLPAVLGAGAATNVLQNGDVVTVDGTKGIVVI